MTRVSVGAVVLNYNGGDVTMQCLRSLLVTSRTDEELRVVLVDNASRDGIASRVRHELPAVEVIDSSSNRGFAGGCNLGIRALGRQDYVALVNSDAFVEPEWLTPLVRTLEDDKGLGAACPKILFAGRYAEVTIDAPSRRWGRGDRRELGVLMTGARVNGDDAWPRAQHVSGFWGLEPSELRHQGQWTTPRAGLRLPVPSMGRARGELRLAAVDRVGVTLSSGKERAEVQVGPTPTWYDVPLTEPRVAVVNNVGTQLDSGGYGSDRGYLEPEDGRFDCPGEVFAWCGAATLLRREYLEDVGLFDERLFLYYEDLELAWRGRRLGWRYQYVPESRVHHLHASSTGEGSALKRYFDERNHSLLLTRHAPGVVAVSARLRYLKATGSYAIRDLVAPVLRGRLPRPAIVRQRLGAFGGYLLRLPAMLATRLKDRRRGLQPPRQSWPGIPS